jgi:hypothetical protein
LNLPTGITQQDLIELRLLPDHKAAQLNNDNRMYVDARAMTTEALTTCLSLLRKHHARERRRSVPNFGFLKDWHTEIQRYAKELTYRERQQARA